MAIQKIAIENFTVFKNIEIEFCDGINVFIGENGTGKTHLLKLLYATHVTHSDSKYSIDNIFGEDFNLSFRLRNLVVGKNGVATETNQTTKVPLNTPDAMEARTQINNFRNSLDKCVTIVASKPENPIFIPAKDMLTHSRLEKDYAERNLPFDRTLIDILYKAGVSTVKSLDNEMLSIANDIAKIISGKIVYRNDRYYIEKSDGSLVGFDMEAEGFKKLGLLYRLIETGYFKKDSVLIWDEPEANLNPKLIPYLADVILALESAGVQMFFATHDYFFAKYLEVRKSKDNKVMYHALHKKENNVLCESSETFELLENNSIIAQSIALYKEEVKKVME